MYKQKDLKKMSRRDLLEILVLQSKKIDSLEEELDKVNEQLSSKRISIEEVGSIAEASLKLNKVFETAQQAADQYLENIKKIEEESLKIKEQLEKDKNKNKKKSNDKKKSKQSKKKVKES